MTLVWKPFIRIFHILLIVAVVSNLFLNEEGDPPHVWIGYGATALVGLRILYGMWSKDSYASFKAIRQEFLAGSRGPFAHFIDHLKGKAKRTLTHPPQAAIWMGVLFVIIFVLGISGYFLMLDEFSDNDLLQEIHEIGANFLKVLIVIHLLGLFKSSKDHKQNLIISMIHGKKKPLSK